MPARASRSWALDDGQRQAGLSLRDNADGCGVVTDVAFSSVEVCDLLGILYGRIDHWDRTGVLRPSISRANGSGTRRLYSPVDLRCARALVILDQQCTRYGNHLRRRVVDRIRLQPDAEFIVILDGRDVDACRTAEQVVASARSAVVTTVIRLPNFDTPEGHGVKVSAESMTTLGAPASPGSPPRPPGASAASASP